MERVNLFNPFLNKPIEHEDRLTWAFILMLKYNLPLQRFLREIVLRETAENREIVHGWEPANLWTQAKNIQIESAPNLIISVLLTDSPTEEGIDVHWSDRNPKYDGVIEFPNELILIIENKLSHGKTWQEQLSPNIESFPSKLRADVKDSLHEQAVCLVWSEVLEGVLEFINSKFAPFGSSEIANDFLTFVEEIHPELTPYRTFSLCGVRPEALEKRIEKLHRDIVARVWNTDRYESDCDFQYSSIFRENGIAQRIYFDCENIQHLRVYLWPANTVTQARQLHEFFIENGNAEFLNFANDTQWTIAPHLRFFSFNNVVNIAYYPDLSVDDYLSYFVDQNTIGQWRYVTNQERGELTEFLDKLESDNLISEQKLGEIKENFFGGNITRMNVVPGFEIVREWSLEEIIQWEEDHELEDRMIEELNSLLDAWGEQL